MFNEDTVSFGDPENTADATFTLSARDQDEGDTLTYELTGADAQFFNIDPATGEISPVDPNGFNYESPQDENADNVYDLIISATDTAGATVTREITYTVGDLPDVAVFNLIETDFSGLENTPDISLFAGAEGGGANGVQHSLGGADSRFFSIDANTGILSFNPNLVPDGLDFENPLDQNGDNTYEVLVSANAGNGGADVVQPVTYTVRNQNEAPVFDQDRIQFSGAENDPRTTFAVSALDGDPGDTVSYFLSGIDSRFFNIGGINGVLSLNQDMLPNGLDLRESARYRWRQHL